MDGVTGLIAAQATARGITIKSDIAPDLPCVRGDPEQLEEVLTNLVSNAVRYSHDGGVVEVRLAPCEESIQIEVADSGIGISDEHQARIFEEFFRSSDAREFTSEGTGLGLSIVKTIVDSHGGTITFESRKGEATRFVVSLHSGREQRAES
jgi:signal transduction histidine kinase